MSNMIGQRYGRLTVVQAAERDGYVIVRCDCGTVKEVRRASLTKAYKPTRSCGCIQHEIASHTGAKTCPSNMRNQVERNISYHTNIQVISKQEPNKNNTSGVSGVSWDSSRQTWCAYINIHGKRIHLGRYLKKSDAIKARKVAEDEYFAPILEEVHNAEGK